MNAISLWNLNLYESSSVVCEVCGKIIKDMWRPLLACLSFKIEIRAQKWDIQTGLDELFFNFACARYHLFDFYIPDDQTRVVLRRRCDRSESDYINANYIRASRLGGSSCSVQSSNESLNSVNCKSWHLPTWYNTAWFSLIIKNGSF